MRLAGSAARGFAASVLAASPLLLPAGPARAHAGGCDEGSGVSVVVDFHEPGHPDVQYCDERGAGRTAAQLIERAGLDLTEVQRQPGFICRVDGRPADAACVNTPPASAYWSLWWSDGGPTWTYATTAAGSLEIPDGGSVGLVWDDVPADLEPAVAPGGAAAGPDHASGASDRPASSAPTAADGADGEDGAGLPAWVAAPAVVLLLAGAATVAAVRRHGGSS